MTYLDPYDCFVILFLLFFFPQFILFISLIKICLSFSPEFRLIKSGVIFHNRQGKGGKIFPLFFVFLRYLSTSLLLVPFGFFFSNFCLFLQPHPPYRSLDLKGSSAVFGALRRVGRTMQSPCFFFCCSHFSHSTHSPFALSKGLASALARRFDPVIDPLCSPGGVCCEVGKKLFRGDDVVCGGFCDEKGRERDDDERILK